LIEPVVDEHDCELVDVEVARNRGMGLLRITVDSHESDGRVPIQRCADISREVETLLDAAESMTSAYRLEVSSPGLNRILGREKDFTAAVGHEVKLRTSRPIEGRKRFRGRLVAVEVASESCPKTILTMQVDGESTDGQFDIPLEEVEKANTIYEFTSADFAKAVRLGPNGSPGKQNKKSGRGR
jgi:ribosome maturation factor RimP